MTNAVITKLIGQLPWTFSLRIVSAEPDTFKALITDLKWHIPSRRRKWDPDGKRWLLRNDGAGTVLALLKGYGLTYVFAEPEAQHRDQAAIVPRSPDEAYQVLHLLPTAPPELVTAAYRTLAKLKHPDHGGDTETMQAINVAVALLSKERV